MEVLEEFETENYDVALIKDNNNDIVQIGIQRKGYDFTDVNDQKTSPNEK